MNKKNIGPLVIIVVLVVLAALTVTFKGKSIKSSTEKVEVAEASSSAIFDTIQLNSTIQALNTAIASARTAGSISNILVEEGINVKKEATLFSFLTDDYEEMAVAAPISGIVGPIAVKIGETISPQTALTTIYEIDKVKAQVSIPEKYYQFLKTDLPVQVKLIALPSDTFTGKIAKISQVIDTEKHVVACEILIDNPKKLIKPGMTALVQMITPAFPENSLKVPVGAIISENGKSYIFVVNKNTISKRKIEVGAKNDTLAEVVSGLKPKELIVISNSKNLFAGNAVKIAK